MTGYETEHTDPTKPYIRVGSLVAAKWFDANPLASLAGMQPKVSATAQAVVGIVTAIHGDHPTRPTKVWLTVRTDLGGPCVEIDADWVRQVL